jgi:hypothetical protein
MVARARVSLGWKTRHSSLYLYPVPILPMEGWRIGHAKVEGGSLALFRVWQVFPGGGSGGRWERGEEGALLQGV